MPKALQRRSFFGWMAAVPAALAAGQAARAAEPLSRMQEPPPAPAAAATEKEMKDLQDQLKLLREAKLPQAVEPAFSFAAMKRGSR